jgi:acyl-CoA oxidase
MAETLVGNFDNLGSLHTELSAFKVFSSKGMHEGTEALRQALGGHGFSAFAGISALYFEGASRITYEGENYMLY